MKYWGKRFFASTRGQVVKLLRRGKKSVNELAEALNVTDNAVRSHLATLQRDALVEEAGKRPGIRKPETLYALTPEAEQLFPKAYHLLLNQLLAELDRRLEPDQISELLREVGRALAEPSSGADLRNRAADAVSLLNDLGGLAEIQETTAGLEIRGYSCPLSASVSEHPEVCVLAEALLTEIVGVPVQEICERDGVPRCAFRIGSETERNPDRQASTS